MLRKDYGSSADIVRTKCGPTPVPLQVRGFSGIVPSRKWLTCIIGSRDYYHAPRSFSIHYVILLEYAHDRPPGASAMQDAYFRSLLRILHALLYPQSSGVKLVNNRKNATEDTEDVAAFNRQQIWRTEQFHEVMQNLTR